jgi:hypothetical protein
MDLGGMHRSGSEQSFDGERAFDGEAHRGSGSDSVSPRNEHEQEYTHDEFNGTSLVPNKSAPRPRPARGASQQRR